MTELHSDAYERKRKCGGQTFMYWKVLHSLLVVFEGFVICTETENEFIWGLHLYARRVVALMWWFSFDCVFTVFIAVVLAMDWPIELGETFIWKIIICVFPITIRSLKKYVLLHSIHTTSEKEILKCSYYMTVTCDLWN